MTKFFFRNHYSSSNLWPWNDLWPWSDLWSWNVMSYSIVLLAFMYIKAICRGLGLWKHFALCLYRGRKFSLRSLYIACLQLCLLLSFIQCFNCSWQHSQWGNCLNIDVLQYNGLLIPFTLDKCSNLRNEYFRIFSAYGLYP